MQTTFSAQTYIARRQKLMEKVGSGRILFIGNIEIGRNYVDNTFPFRQDSTLLYYCGINIPNIHLMIDVDANRTILFGDDHGIEHTIWMGGLPKMRALADTAGIEQVKGMTELAVWVNAETLFLPPYQGEHKILLQELTGIDPAAQNERSSETLIRAVISQRSIKTNEEIEQLHAVSTVSQQMHADVMKATKPGMYEYELVAVASEFVGRHNMCFSYSPILTKRGQILHNHYHGNLLSAGDLVLFDGGGENSMCYAGDITRTWPVVGIFSQQQKEIYDIVHAAYVRSVSLLKPGIKFIDVHRAAAMVILEGLKSIGLVKGDVNEALEEGVHTLFFPHGLGHMIGLDVHDMENLGENLIGYDRQQQRRSEFGWRSLRLGKGLQEGFAITVEPGLYFIPALIELRKSEGKFTNFVQYDKLTAYTDFGGVRIEDDYLITKSGYELLGIHIPTSSQEIERQMG